MADHLLYYLNNITAITADLYTLCMRARNARDHPEQEREAAFQNIRDYLDNNTDEFNLHDPRLLDTNSNELTRQTAAFYLNTQDNSTVLHVLVTSRPPKDLVERIFRLAPMAVWHRANDGASPLQWASKDIENQDVVNYLFLHLCVLARNKPSYRIQTFQTIRDWLDMDIDHGIFITAARSRNQHNSTPLHMLVAAKPPLDLLKNIIKYAPDTVYQRARDGTFPLGIARSVPGNEDVVNYLETFFESLQELYNLCKRARDASANKRDDAFKNIKIWLANDQNPRETKARYTNEVDNSTPLHEGW